MSTPKPEVFISFASRDGECFAEAVRVRLQARIAGAVDLERSRFARRWVKVVGPDPAGARSGAISGADRHALRAARGAGPGRPEGAAVRPAARRLDLPGHGGAEGRDSVRQVPPLAREAHEDHVLRFSSRVAVSLGSASTRPRLPVHVRVGPLRAAARREGPSSVRAEHGADGPPRELRPAARIRSAEGPSPEDRRRGPAKPVSITTSLRGAGGFGKTTLAKALCLDEQIREAFDDGILWVTLGEHPDLRARWPSCTTSSRTRPPLSRTPSRPARLSVLGWSSGTS